MQDVRGWGGAFALAIACACGGDGSDDTTAAASGGAETGTAGTSGATGTGGPTADTGDATTAAPPTSTTGPSPTTSSPDDSSGTGADTGETGDTTAVETGDTSSGASCADGEKNQDETAIDCGGSCAACADGLACFADADCTAGTCDDLVCGQKRFGTWGLGQIGNKTSYMKFLPALHGHHFRFAWADWETAPDVFDDAYMLDDIHVVVDAGLPFGLMMIVAPTSDGNTPDWLFQAPFNVPKVTTTTMQQFPYYFAASYLQRYQHMLDSLRATAAGWEPDVRAAFTFWQSAEGSTGDEGPYKGDPTDMNYAIASADWTAFKRDDVWTPLYAAIDAELDGVRFMVNQGNDGEDFQWTLGNLPGSWLKAGKFTHYYNFSGEQQYSERLRSLRESPPDEHRVRGENEGTTQSPWWMSTPPQNLFALAGSCLHAGVDILNIAPAKALDDHRVYEFFNRYAGIRHPQEGNVGFAALRDAIDLADTERFSEAAYGPLVAPADLAIYMNRVAMIENSGAPPELQETQLTRLLTSGKAGQPFLNAARITKIVDEFAPAANYLPIADDDIDSYNMDFGVHMIPGNYNLWLTQVEPHTTSVGVYRTGAKDQMFGRFGRRFAAADGKDRLTFAVDPGLVDEHTHAARVLVTFLDDGDGAWSLRYWDGAAERTLETVQGGDTGTPVTQVFDVPDLVGGGNLGGGDFALQHEGGGDTVFYLVEIERRARLD